MKLSKYNLFNKAQLYPFGVCKKCFAFFNASHFSLRTLLHHNPQHTILWHYVRRALAYQLPSLHWLLMPFFILYIMHRCKVPLSEVKQPFGLLIFIWLLMIFLCLKRSMRHLSFRLLCCRIRCI
jgi:hypothetical protein